MLCQLASLVCGLAEEVLGCRRRKAATGGNSGRFRIINEKRPNFRSQGSRLLSLVVPEFGGPAEFEIGWLVMRSIFAVVAFSRLPCRRVGVASQLVVAA